MWRVSRRCAGSCAARPTVRAAGSCGRAEPLKQRGCQLRAEAGHEREREVIADSVGNLGHGFRSTAGPGLANRETRASRAAAMGFEDTR